MAIQKVAFEFTGADQTFTVPAGVTEIDLKAWGAGGGGYSVTGTSDGGGGGFASGVISVQEGDVLTFITGQGGEKNDTDGQYGGGGAGGTDSGVGDHGSSGGGRSAILLNGVEVMTAAGGGGGSGGSGPGGGSAGAGGGEVGEDGTDGQVGYGVTPGEGGTGGTQSAGGEGGAQTDGGDGGDGTSGQGGAGGDTSGYGGGGGGGGYFGGGGGEGHASSGVSGDDAGGGGGSGYIGGVTDGVLLGGTGTAVANASDEDYVAGVGVGADDGSGGHGLIVISYEDGAPCFTTGTLIETDQGQVPVETLTTGDMIKTKDHGFQPVRWVGESRVHDAPVRIKAGVFGNTRDLVVSPRHKMLMDHTHLSLMCDVEEAFAVASELRNGSTITQEAEGWVTYYHVLLPQHAVIYAEGAATESFYPDEGSLAGMAAKAKAELLETFDPETYGPQARPTLTAMQAMWISRNLDILQGDDMGQIAAYEASKAAQ